ncbi:MAG: ABC transporter ATP-binding protein [Candidatus Cloacimonas sp.]|jgi:ABC-type nitrate/sulfonate/bicarbonate transport system ATPase subunit|nr:ABC transporter ATP-binding protein [Candidatus Cloacimonas sp.]HNW23903.1 ABC transporter ATP-binding protein [Candidatus Cloacimonas sp.]HNX02225.1 ABC transporter ATP-binding protein [Candidatus Cloacimonas sp.]HPS59731.1 ABC transporter ATP-binding protein [Candidatus Cloacimonas sp.]
MTPESILEAKDIRKSFFFKNSLVVVLDNLQFQITAGQFVSIIGPSGCGKSTFLELLAGITKPDKGNIVLEGVDITGKTGYLGYMPQDDLLFPWLTTMQNILLPVKVKNGNEKEAKKKIMELLPLFGLQNYTEHLPYQLSGGLKQRVALLRTYMSSAEILLLDEPLAKLDALTRSQLQAWLKDIVQLLNLTVILVTHDIDEAIMLSDRIELMSINPGTFLERIELHRNAPLSPEEQLKLKTRIRSKLVYGDDKTEQL